MYCARGDLQLSLIVKKLRNVSAQSKLKQKIMIDGSRKPQSLTSYSLETNKVRLIKNFILVQMRLHSLLLTICENKARKSLSALIWYKLRWSKRLIHFKEYAKCFYVFLAFRSIWLIFSLLYNPF